MTRRRALAIGAALLAAAGAVLLVLAFLTPLTPSIPPPPPQPVAADRSAASSATVGPPPPTAVPTPTPVALAESVPVSVDVPAIAVHSTLLRLGMNPDRTVQVPPLEKDSKAGWFTYSPSPGELGPAVLLGHVDSAAYGPGVFYRLGQLRRGQLIDVTRSDRTVVEFVVDRVESYPKDSFPSFEVYGNTSDAELRLITCGGVFDHASRNYERTTSSPTPTWSP